MNILKQKILPLLVLLAVVFSFVPVSSQALNYDDVKTAQQGKVLGDSTAYPYQTGSLVLENGAIYFIYQQMKVPFTSWSAFVGLGYSLRNVTNGSLTAYSISPSYFITTPNEAHPWGQFLLYNRTIYYSDPTGLIGVPSWDIFLNNGGNAKWIVKANSSDIGTLRANPNLPLLTSNDPRLSGNIINPIIPTPTPTVVPTLIATPTPTTIVTTIPTPAVTVSPTPTPQPTSGAAPVMNYLKKQALVFQIDQGFGNGIIQNEDTVGLQRLITNLQAFQSKYEVYVTLSARQTDKTKLDWALGILAQNNIPFILEVYASDALSLGVDSVNSPYDVQHGREMSVAQLQQYKNKYGNMFAGVRTLEVFAQNFTVLACQQQGTNWCDSFKQNLPTDKFYQKSFLEDYVKFANSNGMFLLFSDFYWSVYHPWSFDQTVVNQNQNEQDLKDLVKAYPNTVVVAFANNEPAQGSMSKMSSWESVVQPYVQLGAKGFGLSDQSWMCSDPSTCPASTLTQWLTSAFASGALVVETEPYWYWFNFPVGAIGPQSSSYVNDPQWNNRGYPSSNLQTLATTVGVTLPTAPSVSPTPTPLVNNAMCVSVQAPDWIKPGAAFTGTVTVKNTGTTTWIPGSATNPNPYRLGAADYKQPPYTSSIWGTPKIELPVAQVNPGDSATFNINTIAPTSTNTYSFGWQMLQDYKEWFGDTCSKNITVSNNPPPATNATAVCPAPGNSAIVSWTAPAGLNTFYLRVKLSPTPADNSAITWNDSFTGTSYTFNTTPGLSYNWWVQTKDPQTSAAGDAVGTTFTCPTP